MVEVEDIERRCRGGGCVSWGIVGRQRESAGVWVNGHRRRATGHRWWGVQERRRNNGGGGDRAEEGWKVIAPGGRGRRRRGRRVGQLKANRSACRLRRSRLGTRSLRRRHDALEAALVTPSTDARVRSLLPQLVALLLSGRAKGKFSYLGRDKRRSEGRRSAPPSTGCAAASRSNRVDWHVEAKKKMISRPRWWGEREPSASRRPKWSVARRRLLFPRHSGSYPSAARLHPRLIWLIFENGPRNSEFEFPPGNP